MKITSLISASAMVLAMAAPVYAQTAPATPAPATAAPATPAPTTAAPATAAPATAGIPAAFTNVPAVQQVNAQLTAQGYTITDVVQNANGSYSVLSTGPAGGLRLITINPATGAVTDTVTNGVPAGTAGVAENGHFEDDGSDDESGNDSDSGRNDDNGRDGGNEGGESEGGNDSDD